MKSRIAHPLPGEVHTPRSPSTSVRRPKPYLNLEGLFPHEVPLSYRRWIATGLMALGLLLAGGMLWGWLRASGETRVRGGLSFGGGAGGIALPRETRFETTSDTEALLLSPSSEPSTEGERDTLPSEPPTEGERDTLPFEPPTVGERDTLPFEPSTEGESKTLPDEGDLRPVVPADTDREEMSAATPVVVPQGCIPVDSRDLSEGQRGVGWIYSEGVPLPVALPTFPRGEEATPAILVVHTHPYEGYHDGSPWLDPSRGGLAQTDSLWSSRGVVALGVDLTRALRDRGLTVIHLRLSAVPEESASSLYERTEAMIGQYCRLYPDIGLVLDLRRSAELTEGGLLRTLGELEGSPCAQLRVTVHGGRTPQAMGEDLAVALALREALWAVHPSICRPVRMGSHAGPTTASEEVRMLTLELGSAGNTYAEAERLVTILAGALEGIYKKTN